MKRLGQLLLDFGWISERDLKRALEAQEVIGGRLGTCLLEVDAINEQLLNQALSKQLGIEGIRPLDLQNIPSQIHGTIPPRVALRCRAIPYRLLGNDLWVALLDAQNLDYLDEIAFATGYNVRQRVANEHRIEIALERYYDRRTTARFRRLFRRIQVEDPTAMILEVPERRVLTRPLEIEVPRLSSESASLDRPRSDPSSRSDADTLEIEPEDLVRVPLERPAKLDLGERPGVVSTTPRAPRTADVGAVREARVVTQPIVLPRLLRSDQEHERALEDVIWSLQQVGTRDDIARAVVDYLAERYPRVALLMATPDQAVRGWMGAGRGFDAAQLVEYVAAPSEPSLFLNLQTAGDFYVGPMPPMSSHRRLMRCWAASLPHCCCVIPIRLGARMVAVLFCDVDRRGIPGNDLVQLTQLAAQVADAIRRYIVRAKHEAAQLLG